MSRLAAERQTSTEQPGGDLDASGEQTPPPQHLPSHLQMQTCATSTL